MSARVLHTVQRGREQEHIKVTPSQTAGRKCFSLPVLKSLSIEGKRKGKKWKRKDAGQ